MAGPDEELRTAEGGEDATLAGGATIDGEVSPRRAALGSTHAVAPGAGRTGPHAITAGEAVGRYRVLERVGAGAMGDVYAAYDPELDRRVALKMLRPERRASEVRRARLLREAQAIARLAHPHVIGVYDVGEVDTQLYLAMEFADGGTLTRWLHEGDRGWSDVLVRLRQAGAGLAAAHAAGIVHRDFKPDNVLLAADGTVKVADFGIARWADGVPSAPAGRRDGGSASSADLERSPSLRAVSLEAMTRTGDTMGTPLYMAPEQHAFGVGDAASDQFAFCVTAWEALFGRRPFQGSTFAALATAKLDERIEDPPPSPMPAFVTRALRRGLAADPAKRWPSMSALVAALGDDPRRRRRRWLGLAGVLGVGAALGALVERPASVATDDPCPSAASSIESVWDAPQRQAVAGHLADTGAPWAEDVTRSVTDGLDAYARGWVELHDRACRATWVEHSDPTDVLQARNECLDQARRQLATTVDWLQSAAPSKLATAVTTVASMPPLEACWDLDSLVMWRELPEDPDARTRARNLHDDTRAFVDGARLLGETERDARLAALLQRARDLGVPSIRTRLQLSQARFAEERGELDRAEEAYETVLWDAIARDDDASAFQGAVELLWLDGYIRGSPEAAEPRQRAAEALLARMGDPPESRAQLLSRLGAVHYAAGDIEAAVAAYRGALALASTDTLAQRLSVADLRFNLASMMMVQGDVDAALEEFDALEAMWTQLVGPEHPELVSLLNNRSVALQRRGDTDAALAAATRAVHLCGDRRGPAGQCVDSHIALATALRDADRLDEAIAELDRAHADHVAMQGPDGIKTIMYEVVLARWMLEAGRDDEVQARLDARDGTSRNGRRVQAHLRGLLREARGDLVGALADQRYEVDAPDQEHDWLVVAAQVARGRVLRALGETERAIEALGPIAREEVAADEVEVAVAQAELARAQLAGPAPVDRAAIETRVRGEYDAWRALGRDDLAGRLRALMKEQGWDA